MKTATQSPNRSASSQNISSNQKEIILNLDPHTIRNLKNLIEESDLTETVSKQDILDHFRTAYGVGDEETVFLIIGEFFLKYDKLDQNLGIAAFLLRRNPKLILS